MMTPTIEISSSTQWISRLSKELLASTDSKAVRRRIVTMSRAGNSVHLGPSLSIVEILMAVCRSCVSEGGVPSHDRFVLSKGHGVMAMYALLGELGLLPEILFTQYLKDGSDLHGLCEASTPGFEACTGSLGHGLPIAVGMAYAKRRLKQPGRVLCLAGDGEMNEGTMWESLLFAGHHKLANLQLLIDANGFQALGQTDSILSMESWVDKLQALGWDALICDGHDVNALSAALVPHPSSTRPRAIVARTIKGKGISFMAGNNDWHYLRLNDETLALALIELSAHESTDA